MFKSISCSALFVLFIASMPLSAKAVHEPMKNVTYLADNSSLEISTAGRLTPKADRISRHSHASDAKILDIAFVLTNAIVGFLLLRRVNKS